MSSGVVVPFLPAVWWVVGHSGRLDLVRDVRGMPVGLGADSPLVGAAAVARMATIV